MSVADPGESLVTRAWQAFGAAGPDALAEVLAPDARWVAAQPESECDGRANIIARMKRASAFGSGGRSST